MSESNTLSTVEVTNLQDTVTLRLLGVHIQIHGGHPGLVDHLQRSFRVDRPNSVESAFPAVYVVIAEQGHGFHITIESRMIEISKADLFQVVSDIIKIIVVRCRPDLRFLHASAVFSAAGALLFVGASTSGKSTLALALQQKGLARIADDLVALDCARGTVHALQSNARLRPFTAHMAEKCGWDLVLSERSHEVLPLAHVFFLSANEPPSTTALLLTNAGSRRSQLLWLCTGEVQPTPSPVTFQLRDERAFQGPASLTICRSADALKSLLNHMLRPVPPLSQLFSEAVPLIEGVKVWNLRVGDLESMVSLVVKAAYTTGKIETEQAVPNGI